MSGPLCRRGVGTGGGREGERKPGYLEKKPRPVARSNVMVSRSKMVVYVNAHYEGRGGGENTPELRRFILLT